MAIKFGDGQREPKLELYVFVRAEQKKISLQMEQAARTRIKPSGC